VPGRIVAGNMSPAVIECYRTYRHAFPINSSTHILQTHVGEVRRQTSTRSIPSCEYRSLECRPVFANDRSFVRLHCVTEGKRVHFVHVYLISDMEGSSAVLREALVAYGCVALWILLSGAVITYNKFLLSVAGFPYPIALTLWHMLFCSAIAFGLVRSGVVESIGMSFQTYVSAILPIGACYSISLWVGNTAYMYLSVSFIQMLKALMPVAVFLAGSAMGTEAFQISKLANMMLIAVGVAVASFGELNFNAYGAALQLGSILAESLRLTLVQLLLQSRGLKLNPITTLYYVSPCCFVFLLVPFFGLELLSIVNDDAVVVNPFYMVTNAIVAFFLNMAVFLLIGKTSALTMNVAGVVKDWMLIGISVWVFHDPVSSVNIGGYVLAFTAVCWYNLTKYRAAQEKTLAELRAREETAPILSVIDERK
jgi:hypothetical protein